MAPWTSDSRLNLNFGRKERFLGKIINKPKKGKTRKKRKMNNQELEKEAMKRVYTEPDALRPEESSETQKSGNLDRAPSDQKDTPKETQNAPNPEGTNLFEPSVTMSTNPFTNDTPKKN